MKIQPVTLKASFEEMQLGFPIGDEMGGKARTLVLSLPAGWTENPDFPIGSDRVRVSFRGSPAKVHSDNWIEVVLKDLQGRSFASFVDGYQGTIDPKGKRIVELGSIKDELVARRHELRQAPSPAAEAKVGGLNARKLVYRVSVLGVAGSSANKATNASEPIVTTDYLVDIGGGRAMLLSVCDVGVSQAEAVAKAVSIRENSAHVQSELPFAATLWEKSLRLAQTIGVRLPRANWIRRVEPGSVSAGMLAEWDMEIPSPSRQGGYVSGKLRLSVHQLFETADLQNSLERELDSMMSISGCQPGIISQEPFVKIPGVMFAFTSGPEGGAKSGHIMSLCHFPGADQSGFAVFELVADMTFLAEDVRTEQAFEELFRKLDSKIYGFTGSH